MVALRNKTHLTFQSRKANYRPAFTPKSQTIASAKQMFIGAAGRMPQRRFRDLCIPEDGRCSMLRPLKVCFLLSLSVLPPKIVDGPLGMAFGVICNIFLVTMLGLPPARASAKVHIVETFTTFVSAVSHILHGNVDRGLFFRLLVPGIIGGVLGAYLLSNVDASAVKPFVLAYLVGIGLYLLVRGLLIGGVAAAPFGAIMAKRVPTKMMLIMVGIVLTVTSAYGVYRAVAG
jgi:uncharacterized membrane protein YfcA